MQKGVRGGVITIVVASGKLSVERSDKTLLTLLTLLNYIAFLPYFALLPYLEGPCEQTNFIFELADLVYIYFNCYFYSVICLVYLPILSAI